MAQASSPPGGSPALQPGAARASFVGRERESAELRSALEASLSGKGQLVLLVGEPGMGKTTLAQRLATEAASLGCRPLWGRCWEGGGAPAFWPWTQVIRACISKQDASVLAELSDLRRLLPELGAHSDEQHTATNSPALAVSDEVHQEGRFRLFDSVTRFLQAAAARHPLVIILDDCHAADEASLLLLQFLARHLMFSPIMVMATYRETEVSLQPRLAELIGNIGREGRSITLRGIAEADVRQFVEQASGVRQDQAVITTLHQTTGGNPFFLSEILRLLIAEGTLHPSGTRRLDKFKIPDSIRAVIHRRLDLLSEITSSVLRLAAVVGHEFDLAVVQKVAELSPQRVLRCIDEAAAAALISEDSIIPDRYHFLHALIAETLYADTPKAELHRLHLQIALAVEGLYPQEIELHLSELAYHYVQSLYAGGVSGEQIDKAIDCASRAAVRARASMAYEDAARLFQMSLRALDFQQRADQRRRCELLLELGDSSHRAGLSIDSRNAFERAADAARVLGNAEDLGRAILGIGMFPSDPGTVNPSIVTLFEEGLRAIGERDSTLRAMLLARLAWELHWSDNGQRRETLSQNAVQIARRLADTETLVYVLINRHLAAWGPDNLQERLAIATETLQLCEKSGTTLWAPQARYLRMVDLLELGDVKAVDLEIEEYSRLGDKSWLPLGYKERAQAVRALMDGRFDESERLALKAMGLGARVGLRSQMAYLSSLLALRREQGRLAELAPMWGKLSDSLSEQPDSGSSSISAIVAISRCWQAFFFAEIDRYDEAKAQFELLAKDNFTSVRRNEAWLNMMAWLSETCAYLEDSTGAASLYELLRPYASRNVVVDLNASYGSVAHYLGMLASTMARFAEAKEHFESALEFHEQMGARPFVARTQYEYAAMLLRQGQQAQQDRATEMLGEARFTARTLGMAALGQKASILDGKTRGHVRVGDMPSRRRAIGMDQAPRHQQVLATVLFTDIVGSTDHAARMGDRQFGKLLDAYYAVARKQMELYSGREIGTAGDGILVIFDRPREALHCACAIRDAVTELGIEIRAGLHTGECEISGDDVRGLAVHIGSRIAATAAPGEVLVSSTVKELVAGAEFSFADKGAQALRGVPDEWRLFRAEPNRSR